MAGLITRLDAVNRMLTAVGEAVILVEQSGQGDYANCSTILDQVTLEALLKGYEFNTRILKLSPDVNGIVTVPPCLKSRVLENANNIVNDGGTLYDKTNNIGTFSAPVVVEVVLLRTFEVCPTALQHEIVARAVRRYQKGYIGSREIDALLVEDERSAIATGEAAEAEAEEYNMLDNPDLLWLRRRTFNNGSIL